MLNTLQTTDIKDKELPLSKRDLHAAIAAFSFCLRAVISENRGTVFFFQGFYMKAFLKSAYEFALCQGY